MLLWARQTPMFTYDIAQKRAPRILWVTLALRGIIAVYSPHKLILWHMLTHGKAFSGPIYLSVQASSKFPRFKVMQIRLQKCNTMKQNGHWRPGLWTLLVITHVRIRPQAQTKTRTHAERKSIMWSAACLSFHFIDSLYWVDVKGKCNILMIAALLPFCGNEIPAPEIEVLCAADDTLSICILTYMMLQHNTIRILQSVSQIRKFFLTHASDSWISCVQKCCMREKKKNPPKG